jgi:type I site-specific restriction-modification system R (restriction) subunit
LEGFTDIATGEARRVQLKLKKTKKSSYLKALQEIDMEDKTAVEEFKVEYFISDEDIENMKGIELLKERTIQDYRSTYNDIREWLRRERSGKETELETINDKASIIESFYKFAQAKLKKEALDLIEEEKLNEEEAKRYIANSLKS